MDQKMTEAEFAREVGCSAATVGRKRRAREIQYHRYGRIVYYLPEDVTAWHETMKRVPASSKTHDLRRVG